MEDLERRLRADMLAEAAAWGGKVLLHREVPSNAAAPGATPRRPLSRAGSRAIEPAGAGAAAEEAGADDGGEREDITRTTQYQPVMQVQAFWETTGDVGDIDQVGQRKKRRCGGRTATWLG